VIPSVDVMGSFLTSLFLGFIIAASLILSVAGFLYIFLLWLKNKDRERDSLHSTLLQILLPRDNEIKIDAAEQLFSSFASIGSSGKLSFLKRQPAISFEIVGLPQDIRFYVNTPNKFKDMVEKQINGAYPDAEITVVGQKKEEKSNVFGNEYNIFSDKAKVAFESLRTKESSYLPIKVYKDLPVDPMSSITSVLAKMTEGEGAAIQIMFSPADGKWKKAGRAYIARTKKAEANPETAKYSADAKELEGIENKISKPGFNAVIRIVVSSSTKETGI